MLLGWLLRNLARNKLSVFVFHKIPKTRDPLLPNELDFAQFTRLLNFIQKNFLVLPLGDALKQLSRGALERGCACLTFDDGYSEWASGALSLLEKRSLPATFFITVGQFLGRPMWHERLARIVRYSAGDMLNTSAFRLPSLPIASLHEKQKALLALEYHFKYLPPVLRDVYLESLENQCGVSARDVPTMTEEQLRTVSSLGFEIGSHTIDHPILGLCDSMAARNEIGGAREILEGMLRVPVKAFAYPNGRPPIDFNHQHVEMVRQAGYDYAVTTQWGTATADTSVYQIPRFTPWGPDTVRAHLQVIRNLLVKSELDKKYH
ncbi:MAG: polysaccharide deacetylase family protein [Candidatus Accumulibacter sp.]|jgi:peptidoglycan/xylan/chitin deacetylase (PgdA/CDA1 family)|nr:polysaccharide deacetylase family protein [Accumulibacter sp.]